VRESFPTPPPSSFEKRLHGSLRALIKGFRPPHSSHTAFLCSGPRAFTTPNPPVASNTFMNIWHSTGSDCFRGFLEKIPRNPEISIYNGRDEQLAIGILLVHDIVWIQRLYVFGALVLILTLGIILLVEGNRDNITLLLAVYITLGFGVLEPLRKGRSEHNEKFSICP